MTEYVGSEMKDLRGPKLGLGNWFIRDIGNKGRIKEKD